MSAASSMREEPFSGNDDWFTECLTFLHTYRWVYDYQVTKVFIERVWEKIPVDWKSCLLNLTLEELNMLPYGHIKEDWPDTFCNFVQTALKMSLPREDNCVTPVDVPSDVKIGMNPKKQHEVSMLASLLDEQMRDHSVNTVVDVGAGLGYLGQVLERVYGYRVISLEYDDSRTHGARRRAETQGKCRNVSLTFDLQNDTKVMQEFSDTISDILRKDEVNPLTCPDRDVKGEGQRPELTVCMTGLHCCGDLTPAMLHYFTKLDCVSLLVCISCCYHRMMLNEEFCFENFPMSQSCKRSNHNVRFTNPRWSLGIPAFRLAAQETRARWGDQSGEDHQTHTRHVGYRAVLELFCHEENLQLTKITRKVAVKKSYTSFTDYIDSVLERVQLSEGDTSGQDVKKRKEKLQNLYLHTEEFFPFIEPLTVLQVILQPVLESLIHMDRLTFLHELNFRSEIRPLFNESISPRNLVLIAKKGR